jgi:hypothetical protein
MKDTLFYYFLFEATKIIPDGKKKKIKHSPIVVITVSEYNNASVNDHRGKRSPTVSINPPFFVAATIDLSKRVS